MLRRSPRLQETGYYTAEGTPSLSYKEILYRVFRRRRRSHGHGVQNMTFMNQDEVTDHHDSMNDFHPQPNTSCTSDTSSNHDMWTTETQDTRSHASTQTMTRRTQDNRSFWTKIVGGLLFLLLLAFATHKHLQLREAEQEVQSLRKHLNMYAPLADTLPNFALESQGARVLHSLSSGTYWPQDNIGLWDRISYWWYSSETRRRVIQGHLPSHPGQCWPFSGDKGHLFIFLSHPVSITHVTLGHITKSQSPHGYIASAPREFSIYGLRTMIEESVYLGKFVYDQDGAAHQTFELPNPDIGVFRYVKLQIDNNWGNIDSTCLYSFRVHGKLPT